MNNSLVWTTENIDINAVYGPPCAYQNNLSFGGILIRDHVLECVFRMNGFVTIFIRNIMSTISLQ